MSGFVPGLAGLLILSGCTVTKHEDTTLIRGSSVSVEVGDALFSLNDQTSYGDSVANSQILQATSAKFFDYNDKSELVADNSFGTTQVLSNDPLTVKYTIADGVRWSDGVPVTAVDLLLAWLANSGSLNSKNFDDSPYIDQETGRYAKPFPSDIVYFDGATSDGLQFVSRMPKLSKDLKSITLTWDQYFVDWPLTLEVGLPAHVVTTLALGLSKPADGASLAKRTKAAKKANKQFVAAVTNRDTDALSKIANAWNSAFNLTESSVDPSVFVSNGPYQIASFTPGEKVDLKANPEYSGARKPRFEEVKVNFQSDPLLQIKDLAENKVDVISPRLETESAEALKGLSGFEISEGYTGSYEHLDLRFSDSKTGSLADVRVRKAFLLTIPRREIQQAVQPSTTDDAEVRSSIVFFPGQPGYEESLRTNGSEVYLEPDIEGAKRLLAEAGAPNPQVCILYDPSSPRRQKEFQLIQASASKAGFEITDCSSPEWFGLLSDPQSSDASIFTWQVRNASFTGLQSIFVTNGLSNFNSFADPKVDGLLSELSITSDDKKQLELRAEMDSELFSVGYGLPLFQSRRVIAFNSKLVGPRVATLAPGIFWNIENWMPTPSSPSPSSSKK